MFYMFCHNKKRILSAYDTVQDLPAQKQLEALSVCVYYCRAGHSADLCVGKTNPCDFFKLLSHADSTLTRAGLWP